MNRRPILTALALALLAAGGAASEPARAAPLGVIEGEVLDVAAEHLDVDVQRGTAVLEGDVHATLGDLVVKCARVEMRYDESPRVEWARGSGGVAASFKGIDATAATVELDVPKRSVILSGGVRIARGRGWVTADRATMDIATGRVALQSVKGAIPVQPPEK